VTALNDINIDTKTSFFILVFKQISSPLYLKSEQSGKMKYNELERLIKKAGCYNTGESEAGHPLWINPKTGV
jgi:hypothetical protein